MTLQISREADLRPLRFIGSLRTRLRHEDHIEGQLFMSSLVSVPQPAAMEAPYEDSKDEQLSPGGKAALLLQRVCCFLCWLRIISSLMPASMLTPFLLATRRDIRSFSMIPSRTLGRDGVPSQSSSYYSSCASLWRKVSCYCNHSSCTL